MIRAKLRISTDNRDVSRSIIDCVEPDNVGMKGFKVASRAASNNAYLSLTFDGGIETFISSLDDLLRCIQAARATLKTLPKEKS